MQSNSHGNHGASLEGSFDGIRENRIEGGTDTENDGKQKPKSSRKGIVPKRSPLTIEERAWRNEEVKRCVKRGFTIRQIVEFSRRWKSDLGTYPEAWRKLQRLGLLDQVRRDTGEPTHEHSMIQTFIGIVNGSPNRLTYWDKEVSLGRGFGVRADISFEMQVGRQVHSYFLEEQDAGIDRKRWRTKLRGYVSAYERKKKLFRVLVRVRHAKEWEKAIEMCSEEMIDHENLDLFWFSIDGLTWMNRWGKIRVV